MKIYISSDHGGFELKQQLLDAFSTSAYSFEDLGPYQPNSEDDYPDYAFPLAEKVANDAGSIGILICKSGNGMVIAANKVKGAYAALCFSVLHAQMARRDDNANIVCLDADYDGDNPKDIVEKFLETEFAGQNTRHGRRFEKIQEYESK